MTHRNIVFVLALTSTALLSIAQEPKPPSAAKAKPAPRVTRPPLFLKEEWKQLPAGGENPIAPAHVGNPNLEVKLYGESGKDIQVTGTAGDENNPIHVWTGECESPCALAFRDKNNAADLTGLARIRWVTKMSGFHQIRPIVKLAKSVRYKENGDTRFVTASVPFHNFKPIAPVTRCCETLKKPSSAARSGENHSP